MENLPLSNNSTEQLNHSSKFNPLVKSAIIFFLSLFLFLSLFYFLFLTAPKNFPEQTIVTVEKGSTLTSISEDLKAKHLIKSKVLFETFVVIYGGEYHIADGDYLFENKLPVFEVARRIVKRDRHLAPVKVTIPEGYDNKEIADAYSSKLRNFNADEFLLEAKTKEGYLFPDTYFFFTNDNQDDVLKYMGETFEKKIKPIMNSITSSGKNENEIITMASIIEREANGDSDRGIISGILWNRISKKMPLQVDAAPETYKTRGLPKNPICNPGLEAIKAAINPIASHYLYYLHDKNGVIHFATTFSEHKLNKIKYLNK